MDVERLQSSDLQQDLIIAATTTMPSTSIQPPPYTAQDAKEFQEKEKLQQQIAKGVDFANVNLANTEAAINSTQQEEIQKPNVYGLMFSEETIRRAFCRKVFSILGILLLKTVVYCAFCTYFQPLRDFWLHNILHIIWGIPIYIASILTIICWPAIRYRSPWNYILLFMFSSSLTYTIGGICAYLQEEVVMIAFAMTAALVLSLTIFAFQTKIDFTAMNMMIFSLAFVIVLTTTLSLSYFSIGGRIALSGLCLFIYSIVLILDIQYIIEGDHRYKLSPEEHIFAVTILYLDIINLFLVILRTLRFF